MANSATVELYRAKVYVSVRGCHFWVTAHVFGWVLAYGIDSLTAGQVVRHRCDETSCQAPDHWALGERAENHLEYLARRGRAGHALGDVRGPKGRAVAIREAIRSAESGRVEEAITAAIAAGNPSGASQPALW